ncbi:hypothetical protein T12_2357 [Trichinella patagoniensis]|uniref:Uncharacterized protein n=1 Tax=Trichinella patagoniensis TaxID=990121 RepID=A0A0V0ZAT6_9BILA|nr:hypothetical protein T12_2357 [Trichinella patagoniensis]
MEALSIFQQVNTGQRECGHDTRHSAFSTKKLFSCIYPDALASYALVALANEHMTASLCKFRRYIDQNSLGEPPPTEWRSLYKDKLKRLLDETESHLRRLTAIAEQNSIRTAWEYRYSTATLYKWKSGGNFRDSSDGTSNRAA